LPDQRQDRRSKTITGWPRQIWFPSLLESECDIPRILLPKLIFVYSPRLTSIFGRKQKASSGCY
jgi:hypothetical protein